MSSLNWADETENEERENEMKLQSQPEPEPVVEKVEDSRENVEDSKEDVEDSNDSHQSQQQKPYGNYNYQRNDDRQMNNYNRDNRQFNQQQNRGGYQQGGYNNYNNNRQQQQGGYNNYNNRQQQQQQQGGYNNYNNRPQQQQGGYNNYNNRPQNGPNNYNQGGYTRTNSVNYRRNEVLITGYSESIKKETFQELLQGSNIEFSDIIYSPIETIVALKDSENYQKAMKLTGFNLDGSQIAVVNYTRKPQNQYQNQTQPNYGQQQQDKPFQPTPRVNPFGDATPVDINKGFGNQPQQSNPQQSAPQQSQQPIQQQTNYTPSGDNKYKPNSMKQGFNKQNDNKYDNKNKFNKSFNNNNNEKGWIQNGTARAPKEQKETPQPIAKANTSIFNVLDDEDEN